LVELPAELGDNDSFWLCHNDCFTVLAAPCGRATRRLSRRKSPYRRTLRCSAGPPRPLLLGSSKSWHRSVRLTHPPVRTQPRSSAGSHIATPDFPASPPPASVSTRPQPGRRALCL